MNPPVPAFLWRAPGPALLAFSCLLLLPVGRTVEAPMLLMALLGLVHAVRHRGALLADARMRLLLAVFAVYWLPIALSLPDSVDPGRTAGSALAQWRFLFAGVYLVAGMSRRDLALLVRLTAWLMLFWMFDALVQYFRGVDLFGFEAWPGRLSGVFGRGNSKFGLTLVVFLPLLWEWVRQRWSLWPTVVAVLASVAFVLLAGSRAAWIAVAVTGFVYGVALTWRARRLTPAVVMATVLAGFVVAGGSYLVSDRVSKGVDRAIDGFLQQGDTLQRNSIYHRLWIWQTAWRMFLDNPVNGVGARNFRNAYRDYASDADPFLHGKGGETPSHSHQLLLETATETGVIGLLGLLALWWLLFRAALRSRDGPPALLALGAGLAGAYFPLNTHLAVYSSYWSQIVWFAVALFCACALRGPPGDEAPAAA